MVSEAVRNVKAYELIPDAESVNPDIGSHAQVVPFEGIDQVSVAMGSISEVVEFPEPVELIGLLSVIRETDFPVIDQGWRVMSKRMLAALKSVGTFSHRVLPVRIIEGRIGRSLAEDPRHDEQGNLKSEFYTDDYVLLQITEYLDVLDLEHSVYRSYDSETNLIVGVKKFVFKDIGQEFPPVFRIPNSPVDLFVSCKAKEALEENGIRGLLLFNHDTGYIQLI
jgi:hypothetical protein